MMKGFLPVVTVSPFSLCHPLSCSHFLQTKAHLQHFLHIAPLQ